jgi:TRAP-type transport system periplasmic protein
MKRVVWVFVCVMVVGLVSMPGASFAQEKKFSLRATNTLPMDHPMNQGLQKLADGVKARTNGNVTILLFPNSQLGGNTEMVEGLQLGTIDICNQFAGAFANYAPEVEVLALAFLFTSEDHLFKSLNGKAGEILAVSLRAKGFEPLGYFFGGSRSLMNNIRPINTPKDLKGLKIRTIPTKITLEGINRMGAIATPMGQAEVYSALEQKVLDGWENSPTTLYTLKLHEVTKFVSLTRHFMTPDLLAISSKTWTKLPADYKKIISEEAKKAADFERKLWNTNEADIVTKLKAAGVKFNEVSDIKAFRDATKPLWNDYEGKYKNGLVNAIQKTK